MKILDKIKAELNFHMMEGHTPKAIIIHPVTERRIFIDDELSKSESVESYFKLPVILSKEVKEGDVWIAI